MTTITQSNSNIDDVTMNALERELSQQMIDNTKDLATRVSAVPRPTLVDPRTAAPKTDSGLDQYGNVRDNTPQLINQEVQRNRESYNSTRLDMVSKHGNNITSLELSVEKLVAAYNVEKTKEDDKFLVATEKLREHLDSLMRQIESINNQIDRESLGYSERRNTLENKFKDNMENLSLMIESERSALTVLTKKDRPASPFAASALAQPTLPEDTRKPQTKFSEQGIGTTSVRETQNIDIS